MLPGKYGVDRSGIDVDDRTMAELTAVSRDDWRKEAASVGEFFARFDGRLPAEMARQREALEKRLG
jgi:GTP-dependent phosphoenolpyruvate carboxykinase